MGTNSDAVRFKTKITDSFYKIVNLKSSVNAGLTMTTETVLWWMQQSDEARGE